MATSATETQQAQLLALAKQQYMAAQVPCPDGWCWRNLVAWVGADQVLQEMWGKHCSYALFAFELVWYVAAATMGLKLLVHQLLMRTHAYRSMPEHQRAISCMHACYLVAMAGTLPWMTYFTLGLLFGPHLPEFVETSFKPLFTALMILAIFYIIEGAQRTVMRPNVLLMLHHTLFFVAPPLMALTKSVLVFKACFILCYFTMYELGLYSALLMRRFNTSPRSMYYTTYAGLVVYALSRVWQTLLLALLFGWGAPRYPGGGAPADAGFWIIVALSGVLTVLQQYTFKIYGAVLHKAKRAWQDQLEGQQLEEGGAGGKSTRSGNGSGSGEAHSTDDVRGHNSRKGSSSTVSEGSSSSDGKLGPAVGKHASIGHGSDDERRPQQLQCECSVHVVAVQQRQ